MYFDHYGCIVREQIGGGFPGSIGDSCAETSRYRALDFFVNAPDNRDCLNIFFTDKGIIRHPLAPVKGEAGAKKSWREEDTPSDQVLPLAVAWDLGLLGEEPTDPRIFNLRTGNGDIVSPKLFAVQKRLQRKHSWFYDTAVLGQAYIFKLPYRWNDERASRFENPIEETKDSSCDYLNWLMCIVHAVGTNTITWSIKKSIEATDGKEVFKKILSYYADETNCIVLPLYQRAIERIWKCEV